MLQMAIFIARQLFLEQSYDDLFKIGMYTAFFKANNTKYDFGGRVLHEDENIVIFAGKPKRITIEGENLTEAIDVSVTAENYVGYVQSLKQTYKLDFYPDHFTIEGCDHHTLVDLAKLYNQSILVEAA